MSDDDRPMLSGWCSPTDQYHKGCRWALCQCPRHVAESSTGQGETGRKRYNGDTTKAAQSDSARTPSLIPGPRRSSLEGAID